MKITFLRTVLLAFFLLSFSSNRKENVFVQENFKNARMQFQYMLSRISVENIRFPSTIDKSGKLVPGKLDDWTSGFFPGNLWQVYEYTGDQTLKAEAIRLTEQLEPLKNFTQHHDVGFMMYCSYGNAYRLTGNEIYKSILVQTARSLCSRFNPVTGCIKSWDSFISWHNKKTYFFPVIIDNLMNLELLFFASKVTGDTSFRHIAISHALQTIKYHVRPDFSSFHVVCLDSVSDKVIAKETSQGYADNSTWARGQAWGIYGFSMLYRETKDVRFLKVAKGMADFFINNKRLPSDKIPYWDFNAQQKGYVPGTYSNANNIHRLYRDASAAAIVASALLELSTYSAKKGPLYINTAVEILHSLSSPTYRAALDSNEGFLLKHCVGSIPDNVEINVPLVYADYYFLEALMRYNKLLQGDALFDQ